jgi:hypothetical protein
MELIFMNRKSMNCKSINRNSINKMNKLRGPIAIAIVIIKLIIISNFIIICLCIFNIIQLLIKLNL